MARRDNQDSDEYCWQDDLNPGLRLRLKLSPSSSQAVSKLRTHRPVSCHRPLRAPRHTSFQHCQLAGEHSYLWTGPPPTLAPPLSVPPSTWKYFGLFVWKNILWTQYRNSVNSDRFASDDKWVIELSNYSWQHWLPPLSGTRTCFILVEWICMWRSIDWYSLYEQQMFLEVCSYSLTVVTVNIITTILHLYHWSRPGDVIPWHLTSKLVVSVSILHLGLSNV